jgi:serine/threonine protein kinase
MLAVDAQVSRLRAGDPSRIGGYTLCGRLGSGGTADVFLAQSARAGTVALKVVRPDVEAGHRACRQEYHLMRRVGTVTATPIGYGHCDRGDFFSMRYLEGYVPASSLRPGVMLLAIANALARTLAVIHSAGIIHCDVKPANILVRGTDVRLIDFGIARLWNHQPRTNGVVHCSRGWAAPEQLRGLPLSYAADVFAWGCVVAFLAGGVHPFASNTEQEWVLRVFSAEPELWALPPGLANVVRAALHRDPAARPTAAQLVQATL